MVGEGTPVASGQHDTLRSRKVTVTKPFVLIRSTVVVPHNRISEVNCVMKMARTFHDKNDKRKKSVG